ncbi:hypothetical protein ACOSQ2_032934 [Xanthoceras sorbifolium]
MILYIFYICRTTLWKTEMHHILKKKYRSTKCKKKKLYDLVHLFVFYIGKKCKLLHWIGSGEIVVETEIECTDPQTSVHHMVLGPDHWKIAVKKILVSKVNLYRPTSDLHKLEDARGF